MKVIHFCLLMILLPTLVPAAELSVFAASSLTEVLREAAQTYETRHPDDRIMLYFAGSQTLATQIEQGAPADLLIAANTAVMDRLQRGGLVENPRLLLRNRLILAVHSGLVPQITSVKDLARPNLLLLIGNRQVPIGSYTRQMLANIATDPAYGAELVRKIEQNIVSEENKVKAIIAKLLLGEVDAGIVYQSDLTASNASQLTAVPLPDQHNPKAIYPVAKTIDAKAQADDFISFLFSSRAQNIFKARGFLSGDGQ